jgi:SAM-dependent methyltransferase
MVRRPGVDVNESSKSKKWFSEAQRRAIAGRVLDIGAGTDPVVADAVVFDLAHGDANHITAFEPGSFDCVYSSHCLEHMHDPVASLANWWSLVRPGGTLFLIVPDEDLYEQGVFPSRFNDDHKSTFTLGKKRSWSPRSFNVFDLCAGLPGGRVESLCLNDIGYDRGLSVFGPPRDATLRRAARFYESLRKRRLVVRNRGAERWAARTLGRDQTRGEALAQIEAVVRKV